MRRTKYNDDNDEEDDGDKYDDAEMREKLCALLSVSNSLQTRDIMAKAFSFYEYIKYLKKRQRERRERRKLEKVRRRAITNTQALGDMPELPNIIHVPVPPGKLGIRVKFKIIDTRKRKRKRKKVVKYERRNDKIRTEAIITAIYPTCQFQHAIDVGDRIVSMDGKLVTCERDLMFRKDDPSSSADKDNDNDEIKKDEKVRFICIAKRKGEGDDDIIMGPLPSSSENKKRKSNNDSLEQWEKKKQSPKRSITASSDKRNGKKYAQQQNDNKSQSTISPIVALAASSTILLKIDPIVKLAATGSLPSTSSVREAQSPPEGEEEEEESTENKKELQSTTTKPSTTVPMPTTMDDAASNHQQDLASETETEEDPPVHEETIIHVPVPPTPLHISVELAKKNDRDITTRNEGAIITAMYPGCPFLHSNMDVEVGDRIIGIDGILVMEEMDLRVVRENRVRWFSIAKQRRRR